MQISYHAICQYQARVKPLSRFAEAKKELTTLVENAGAPVSGEKMSQVKGAFRPDREYVELSDGIYGAVVRDDEDQPVISTLLIRGSMSKQMRARKNKVRPRHMHKHRQKKVYHREKWDEDPA